MIQNAGTQLVTADIAVGDSGTAVRIFCIHIISGASAGVVDLYNGTSTGGTRYVSEDGTASKGKTVFFGPQGFVFPDGCYVDVDSNVTSVLVSYNYV